MRLIIFGAGGYGRTVADVARQSGRYTEIAFLDDAATGAHVLGKCGDYARFADGNTQMYPAFGNNEGRIRWLNTLEAAGIPVPTLVHERAYVSPEARLEPGVVVLPFAVVNTECVVKRGCIVNIGALVDHGCVLEEGVHVSPGGIIKAENRIPALTKIESGQMVPNRTYPV